MSNQNNASTYFRIIGKDINHKCLRNVKADGGFLDEVGSNRRLVAGHRVTLRRPHLLNLRKITISGDSVVPAPLSDISFGDEIEIDVPKFEQFFGDYAREDLPFSPGEDRIWYFGETDDKRLIPLQHGDPRVTMTMWIPRVTIMIDAVDTGYDDTRAVYTWSIKAEYQP
jgi:hypothetical protein